jgi:hypothetical protein
MYTEQERSKYVYRQVDIPARCYITDALGKQIREAGFAKICKISLNGVLISDVIIPSRTLPITTFKIGLFIEDNTLGKIQMLCSVRKVTYNGSLTLGLNIERIPEKHRERIEKYLKNNELQKNLH